MKICEYQKKFEELFAELEAEHGSVASVEIMNKMFADENGKYTIKRPFSRIHFIDD